MSGVLLIGLEESCSSNDDIAPSNDIVFLLNDGVTSSNDGIVIFNDEVESKQNFFHQPSNDEVAPSNDEVAPSNDEVAPSNDEVTSSNDGILSSNDGIIASNEGELLSGDPVNEGVFSSNASEQTSSEQTSSESSSYSWINSCEPFGEGGEMSESVKSVLRENNDKYIEPYCESIRKAMESLKLIEVMKEVQLQQENLYKNESKELKERFTKQLEGLTSLNVLSKKLHIIETLNSHMKQMIDLNSTIKRKLLTSDLNDGDKLYIDHSMHRNVVDFFQRSSTMIDSTSEIIAQIQNWNEKNFVEELEKFSTSINKAVVKMEYQLDCLLQRKAYLMELQKSKS